MNKSTYLMFEYKKKSFDFNGDFFPVVGGPIIKYEIRLTRQQKKIVSVCV